MTIRRRDFFKTAAAAAAAASPLSSLLSGGALGPAARMVHGQAGRHRGEKPLIVTIYFRGGQDALNTVVPWGSDEYYEKRPTIAIADEAPDPSQAVLKLDDMFGLHPALAPLMPLWDSGCLMPIVCAGSPHPTRSHFDAQDFMEYAAPGNRTVRDGWLNRYLSATSTEQDAELRAVGMQKLLPRSLRGKYPVVAIAKDNLGSEDLLDEFEALYGEDAAMSESKNGDTMRRKDAEEPGVDGVKVAGQTTVRALRRYEEVAKKNTGSKVTYPRGGLGSRLRRIAHLVRAGEPVEVACVDSPSWDHHTREGALEGLLAPKLREVGAAIAAFARDLGPAFDRTLILTMTEFGRTVAENGNSGTDHGHGSVMLCAGGSLAGKKVLGDWTGLRDDALYQGRDLRVTTDFRDVMAEALEHHMGFELPRGFFPDFKPKSKPGLFG